MWDDGVQAVDPIATPESEVSEGDRPEKPSPMRPVPLWGWIASACAVLAILGAGTVVVLALRPTRHTIYGIYRPSSFLEGDLKCNIDSPAQVLVKDAKGDTIGAGVVQPEGAFTELPVYDGGPLLPCALKFKITGVRDSDYYVFSIHGSSGKWSFTNKQMRKDPAWHVELDDKR